MTVLVPVEKSVTPATAADEKVTLCAMPSLLVNETVALGDTLIAFGLNARFCSVTLVVTTGGGGGLVIWLSEPPPPPHANRASTGVRESSFLIWVSFGAEA